MQSLAELEQKFQASERSIAESFAQVDRGEASAEATTKAVQQQLVELKTLVGSAG